MKKMSKFSLTLLIFCFTIVLNAMPFFPGHYYDNTIIVSFNSDAIPNLDGKLDFSIENGVVQTGLDSFDAVAKDFGITSLEQMTPHVKDKTWTAKDGTRIQNLYRVLVKSNDVIESALTALTKNEYVISANYETINREKWIPNDPQIATQWFIEKIDSYRAWDIHNDASDVVIGIVDSGVRWTHPDLQDNIFVNEAEMVGASIDWENGTVSGNGIDDDGNGKVDDIIGWNFYDGGTTGNNNTNQTVSSNDHGTHVAGCASAVGNNGVGIASPALNAKILVATCSSVSVPSGLSSRMYNAIVYCADMGADIINCSWGGPANSTSSADYYIDYATDQGALVFAAAGNGDDSGVGIEHGAPFNGYVNGYPVNTSYYIDTPADCGNAICVAATNHDDEKTGFSDYGNPIDLASPGYSIYATIVAGQSYGSNNGTSMASPVAAGVAALIKGKNPDYDVEDLRERVLDTADYIDDVNDESLAGLLGSGRVNSFNGVAYGYVPNLLVFDTDFDEIDGDNDGEPNIGEEIEMTFQLLNEPGWLDAENIVATLATDLEGVNIIDGDATFPFIMQSGIGDNNDDPFVFSTASDLATNIIPFTLTLSADAAPGYEYNIAVEVEIELSLMQADWPIELDSPTKSAGVFADLNGNNEQSFIFGEANGNIHIVGADVDDEIVAALNSTLSAPVAIGNVDSDDDLEIVVALSNGTIKIIEHDGTIADFEADAGSSIKTAPAIADVDGNGENEIITLDFTSGDLNIFNQDGSTYPNFPVSAGGRSTGFALGDINADGHLDIVNFSLLSGGFKVIDSTTGEMFADFATELLGFTNDSPTIANVDGDTNDEIFIVDFNGRFIGIDNDGSMLFEPVTGHGEVKTNVVCADLDNDSSFEFMFANTAGEIYCYEADGQLMENFPIETNSVIEASPVLVDTDSNGTFEIIIANNTGTVYGYNLDGGTLPGFPMVVGGSISTALAIGDIDTDGDKEIAVTSVNNYYMIDIKLNYGAETWACLRGSIGRTGNVKDIANVVENDEIPSTSEFILRNNYPNPFNPETTISFNLPKAGNVNLSIYNIKGQKVKTLVNKNLEAKRHDIKWLGKDKNGNAVASGIYFYRLESNNKVETKKMILMK